MNKFLKEFKDRGYFYQCTNENELSNLLDKKSINAYIGFDSTAASLHVGSLMQIMCLKLLQKHGHRPIVLLGGGTTRIGDPSGKEETRKILSETKIEKNIKNIQNVFKIFLIFFSICASDKIFLVSSLPDGSPILVVPPPNKTIGLCPCFCNNFRHIICIKLPTCKLAAVLSKPI